MDVIIAGKKAHIAENTTFELTFENRRFTGADTYSLSITFPMADCPDNVAIFGHINRRDVAAGLVLLDAVIVDKSLILTGALAIVEISRAEVKGQFLSGRSSTNYFNTWDDIYINELPLGLVRTYDTDNANTPTPQDLWKSIDESDFVALPWINTQTGVIHNEPYTPTEFQWLSGQTLSVQTYLIRLTEQIFSAAGYTSDLSEWEASELRNLVVMNLLPPAWEVSERARTLPAWSLSEFVEQLGLFLRGEFDVDHAARIVRFHFFTSLENNIAPVRIATVLRDFTSEISTEELAEIEHIDSMNLEYAPSGTYMDKFRSCNWFLRLWQNRVEKYATTEDLVNAVKSSAMLSDKKRHGEDKLFYVTSTDTYYILRTINVVELSPDVRYLNILQPVNEFGPRRIINDDDAAVQEIKIVPVPVDWAEFSNGLYNKVALLPTATYSERDDVFRKPDPDETDEERKERTSQTLGCKELSLGEPGDKCEYYSLIFVGLWTGYDHQPDAQYAAPACPWTVTPYIADEWRPFTRGLSLRINSEVAAPRSAPAHTLCRRQKYTFKFLADTPPNPLAVFHIDGRRYLAKSITATFTSLGLSELFKGEFYMIDE